MLIINENIHQWGCGRGIKYHFKNPGFSQHQECQSNFRFATSNALRLIWLNFTFYSFWVTLSYRETFSVFIQEFYTKLWRREMTIFSTFLSCLKSQSSKIVESISIRTSQIKIQIVFDLHRMSLVRERK